MTHFAMMPVHKHSCFGMMTYDVGWSCGEFLFMQPSIYVSTGRGVQFYYKNSRTILGSLILFLHVS